MSGRWTSGGSLDWTVDPSREPVWEAEVQSPVNLSLFDAQGRRTGELPNDRIQADIPGQDDAHPAKRVGLGVELPPRRSPFPLSPLGDARLLRSSAATVTGATQARPPPCARADGS